MDKCSIDMLSVLVYVIMNAFDSWQNHLRLVPMYGLEERVLIYEMIGVEH